MSYGSNNFRPTPGNWGPGQQGYAARVPNNMPWDYMDERPQPRPPPAAAPPSPWDYIWDERPPPPTPSPRSVWDYTTDVLPLPPPRAGNQGRRLGYNAYALNNPVPQAHGNWRPGQGYGAYVPNTGRNYMDPFTRLRNDSEVAQSLRLSSFPEDLFEVVSFPVQPHSSLQLLVLNNDHMGRDANRRPRQSTRDRESPPMFTGGRNIMQAPIQEESSRLTQDEQKAALKQLKKEIYNPTPKRLARRLGLYYRDKNMNNSSGKEKEKDDEDSKRCAICLEDFEPSEMVMLTPCSHMFHEDCIVPWVKGHGQCPVCRFTICERIREIAGQSNNNTAIVPAGDLFEGELVSVIRMMDEALEFGNRNPYIRRDIR
ncbi:hypothetical protein F0562_011397 [Nyssa sinensis]|uniref:RING-type domain-containing protein n=1 Tax=Nyssa sinensis TaxID=561372 RepID=A0A5J5A1L2_9ASTE|nr:hypothetical protein F0562_011397 [Nyssa sinensis]